MDEYIEREKAYEKCGWYNTVNGKSICAARKDELAAIPAADVAPVRHGQWISWEKAGNFVPSPDRHEYSVCHDAAQVLVNGFELLSDYCPNCGAKMDVGANHEVD